MAGKKKDKDVATPATSANSGGASGRTYIRGKDGTHPLDPSFRPSPEGVVEELGGDELQTLRTKWGGKQSYGLKAGDYWHSLEEILAQCDEVMRRHGWVRKAGNKSYFLGDRSAEAFSELWYAGKIGSECWHMLTFHRSRGPNEVTLAQASELGRLLTEDKWRRNFKPSTITRSACAQGGQTRRRNACSPI